MNGVSSPTTNPLSPEHYRRGEHAVLSSSSLCSSWWEESALIFSFLLHIPKGNCDRLVSADGRIWVYT
jgi:hypothetical protein